MPIYAYKCASCGHAKDVLQKLSDAPLTVCPSCGAASFGKQLTAAGFQLKGSGWYATDFKNGSSAKPATGGADGKTSDGAKTGEPAKTGESAKTEGSPAVARTDAPTASDGGCGGACACH
ncbi:MAG: zinc ribbon domain-containing protein [Ramlibacter sp.]|nr:zinc ribbon domain-containing protein [Ramlibacter sp.]